LSDCIAERGVCTPVPAGEAFGKQKPYERGFPSQTGLRSCVGRSAQQVLPVQSPSVRTCCASFIPDRLTSY